MRTAALGGGGGALGIEREGGGGEGAVVEGGGGRAMEVGWKAEELRAAEAAMGADSAAAACRPAATAAANPGSRVLGGG